MLSSTGSVPTLPSSFSKIKFGAEIRVPKPLLQKSQFSIRKHFTDGDEIFLTPMSQVNKTRSSKTVHLEKSRILPFSNT
uniref:Uncharacterized protein n=1 Tax=Arundo donax TaxID=35708 RepID=A0A0A9ANQ2_ARUDO